MENTLTILSVVAMVSTSILALYAIHVMRKYKRTMYQEGYYRGFIEGEIQASSDEESGMRKDCIHCKACSMHVSDYYECPEDCAQYDSVS